MSKVYTLEHLYLLVAPLGLASLPKELSSDRQMSDLDEDWTTTWPI
jgi:hypothetical protein